MFSIYFYRHAKGYEPVLDYLRQLANQNNKDARIQLNKINDYIEILSRRGTRIGAPFVKYLYNDIWELRPLNHRILFISWHNNSFILLHHFIKKSKKTPKREIEIAIRALHDIRKRGFHHDK